MVIRFWGVCIVHIDLLDTDCPSVRFTQRDSGVGYAPDIAVKMMNTLLTEHINDIT